MANKKSWRRRLADRLDPDRKRDFANRRSPTVGKRAVGEAKIAMSGNAWGSWGSLNVITPPTPEEDWHIADLDTKTLSKLRPNRLAEYLTDLSPEVSAALWGFLRMCNPGYEIKAYHRGGVRPYAKAQVVLDEFINQLVEMHGTLDVLINRLYLAAWLRGAFLTELILHEDGRTAADLVTPDPWVVRFKAVQDPLRGQVWEMGQYQKSKWVSLDDLTIRYIPVDPLPGSPYGRPLVSPALFAALFLLGLLHDLRRVISQQGYPRLDLVINLERLLAGMPDNLQDDDDSVRDWIQTAIDDIVQVYSALEPDDAYVHTDVVEVHTPIGAMNANSMGAMGDLIRGVERMAMRALKTMPIFMGSNEAVAESHARWQWEIQTAGIRTLQHLAENSLGYQFTLALRAQGLDAHVQVRFAELNEITRRERADTERAEIENAARKRDEGWITQDEAAMEIVGHAAVEEQPRSFPPVGALGRLVADVLEHSQEHPISLTLGDGLAQRGRGGACACGRGHAGRRLGIVSTRLIGADEPLPEAPEEVDFTEEDIDRASELWDELMAEDFDVGGLLEAEVDEEAGAEEEEGGSAQGERAARMSKRADDDGPRWVWEPRAHRYRDRRTGRFIGPDDLRELRNAFVDRLYGKSDRLTQRLFDNEISVQRWLREMRTLTKDAFSAQYMAARGGRNAMTQADWGRVGRMVRDQYSYLQGFAQDLQADKVSVGQAQARARMYMEASTQAHEQGKRVSYGLPSLPQYPGDGSTECLSNCRCFWLIREFGNRWECTWTLDPEAEHCTDCARNASEWRPLVIAKEGS